MRFAAVTAFLRGRWRSSGRRCGYRVYVAGALGRGLGLELLFALGFFVFGIIIDELAVDIIEREVPDGDAFCRCQLRDAFQSQA